MPDAWLAAGYSPREMLSARDLLSVVRATRSSDGLAVICKMANAGAPPKVGASLRREYAILNRIEHAAVIRPVEIASFDGREMLVLHDIGGLSLDQICRTGPLSVAAFLDLAISIVDGLAAVHAVGVVHRNLTPANIICNRRTDAVNLVDFAIASELVSEETEGGDATPAEGSLAYMAPEQTGRMNRSVDYRADFYGLGATFYQLLTGRPPFETEDPLELIHSHIARSPIPACAVDPSIPVVLSAIIDWMMAKDPENRCQSCFGLKADLLRCREQWTTSGAVQEFDLGRQDRRPVLRMPQRLYGRREHYAVLASVFRRVAAGGHELAMVCGFPGIGKSALVNELRADVARAGGMLVTGKFELLNRSTPCAAIVQAVGEFLRRVGDRGVAQALQTRLIEALGELTGVVAAVVPELTSLIGSCPPPAALGPIETENRFIHAFRLFVRALPAPNCPVVIFLDDLQWADSPSLKLLEALATDTQFQHLMIVGAYRDNEVIAPHPLLATLKKLEESVHFPTIRLVGLDDDALTELLADTLQAGREEVRSLARVVRSKSMGNPLHLNQYLAVLDRRKLVTFDYETGQWIWNLDAITREPMPDDLTELMLARLRDLPADTLSALSTAACIGTEFDLTIVAAATGRSTADASALLWPALLAGLVLPIGSAYRFAGSVSERVAYRFAHDRIEQAAYSVLDETERQTCHLRIGRLISGSGSGHTLQIFDIVHHLNKAAPLLDEAERLDLAALNLRAARNARASVAFGPALDLLTAGLRLLPEASWQQDYEVAAALHLETAEMAAWSREDAIVQQTTDAVLAHARTALERARAFEALSRLQICYGQLPAGLRHCRTALNELGIRLPATVRPWVIAFDVARTKLALWGKRENDLIGLPTVSDPVRIAIARLFHMATACAYQCDPDLFVILICRLVRATLSWGNHPWAGDAYTRYGVILTILRDYPGARRFSRVAKQIGVGGNAAFVCAGAIDPWIQPVQNAPPELQAAHYQSMFEGDIETATYCLSVRIAMQFVIGTALTELRDGCDAYTALCIKLRHYPAPTYRQAIACLTGEVPSATRFEGPYADEETGLPTLVSRGSLFVLKWSYDILAYLNLLFGRYEDAARFAVLSRPYNSSQKGTVMRLRAAVIAAIIECITLGRASPPQRVASALRLAAVKRELKAALGAHPGNFDHLHALLAAEQSRAHGRTARALLLYETAIAHARAGRYCHDEGLACERAGELALAMGDRGRAEGLYRDALAAFETWEATAKTTQLAEKIEQLFGAAVPDAEAETGRSHGAVRRQPAQPRIGSIDVSTVVRASLALAENVRLADLLQTMMRLVIANAGATQGFLLLEAPSGWRIEAIAQADEETVQVLTSLPLDPPEPLLAIQAVRHVITTLEPLVIADLSSATAYRDDPYVVANRPRSLLCLPLRHRNQLAGLLYLENNLAAGVFSPERVELLNLISTQIAISIENARLYEEMEARVRERTRALAGLLDNSGQGFLSFGSDLLVDPRYSRACEAMLGGPPDGRNAATLFFPDDPGKAELLATGTAMILEEPDPDRRAVLLTLLPNAISLGPLVLSAQYRVLEDGHMMVVLTDITEERQLAEKAENERQLLRMVVAAMTDSGAFLDTVDAFREFVRVEAPNLLRSDMPADWLQQEFYREVHTYRSALSQFSFRYAPELLQGIESRLEGLNRRQGPIARAEIAEIMAPALTEQALEADLAQLHGVLGDDFLSGGERITLTVAQTLQLEQLASGLLQSDSVTRTAEMRRLLVEIASLRQIPLRDALTSYDRALRQIASRLEREISPLLILGDDSIRIDVVLYRPFLRALIHLFRNAITHGIEDPDERLAAGKDECGQITCTMKRDRQWISLVIADDGRGIDVEALRQRAAERGLCSLEALTEMSDAEVLDMIFLDGLSTRPAADQFSGRGVGLAAVRAATERLGGTVSVQSTPSRGTRFSFRLRAEPALSPVPAQ